MVFVLERERYQALSEGLASEGVLPLGMWPNMCGLI
jgi:hypothetical protein